MLKTIYAGWKLNINSDNLFISCNKQNKSNKQKKKTGQTVGYHLLNATKKKKNNIKQIIPVLSVTLKTKKQQTNFRLSGTQWNKNKIKAKKQKQIAKQNKIKSKAKQNTHTKSNK